jgi:16S rRNA (cytosine967-C5)-methyltransferase
MNNKLKNNKSKGLKKSNPEPTITYLMSSSIDCLRQCLEFKYPSDQVISHFFKTNKISLSKARYIIAETVYMVIRNLQKLKAITDDIPSMIALVWAKYLQLTQFNLNDVDQLELLNLTNCDLSTKLGELTKLETKISSEDGASMAAFELPQWAITELLKSHSNQELYDIAISLQQRANLNVRVNSLKTNLKKLFIGLEQEGFNLEATKLSPYGLVIKNKNNVNLNKSQLLSSGEFEIQDEASQLAGMLLNPKSGDMVVDFCAGGGGKTLLLGMLMRAQGRIYAFDINSKRLANLRPRLARAGLNNVHAQVIEHERDTKIKRLYNKIDKVFVDAPCSGFGTLRRNPDLRYRQTKESLLELNHKQKLILTQSSKLVKVGGYVVYATCSIFACENEDIVNTFLSENPNFKLVAADCVLAELRVNDESNTLKQYSPFLKLLPNIHGTDGFFAALLQRIA